MNTLKKIWRFYYEGFRGMTLGRTLWAVIIIKLFIIFVVLKLLFFPDFLSSKVAEGGEAEYVGNEMVERSN